MRKLIMIVVLMVLVGVSYAQAISPVVPDSSTILVWRMDTSANGKLRVADMSPNCRLTGGKKAVEWKQGKFGTCSWWNKEAGSISAAGNYFPRICNAFTVQAWISPSQLPTGKAPVKRYDIAGIEGAFVLKLASDGKLRAGIFLGAKDYYDFTQTPLKGKTVIPTNKWTHVALAYDGPAGKLGIFVNGKLDAEMDIPSTTPMYITPQKHPFFIRSHDGKTDMFVGGIDDVMLSDSVITFGHKWVHAPMPTVYFHQLRRKSSFMVGIVPKSRGADYPDTVKFTIKDSSGKVVASQNFTGQQAGKGAVIACPGLPAGEYQAVVDVAAKGSQTKTLLDRTFMYTPLKEVTTRVDDDMVIHVNGKPFFPIGLYHVKPEDVPVTAKAGFNVLIDIKNRVDNYADICAKHGVLCLANGFGVLNPATKWGKDVVIKHRNNPNVLAWYVEDEPAGKSYERAEIQYHHGARWDPTHSMFILHNHPEQFHKVAQLGDIFSVDPYPFTRAPLRMVSQWTRQARAAVFDKKPVWTVIQSYTFTSADPNIPGWNDLPTEERLRCMTYLALAGGARGLLYYAFDDSYINNGKMRGVHLIKEHPEYWETLKKVVAEVGKYPNIWLAPFDKSWPVRNLTPKVVVADYAYKLDSKRYLLIVNPTETKQAVSIHLPQIKGKLKVGDLFSKAQTVIDNEILTDTLGPYQSKCYVINSAGN